MSKYTAEECCGKMLDADRALYEKCLDTPNFAFWWNQLGMRAKLADELLSILDEMLPDWDYMRSGESPANTKWRDDLNRRAHEVLAKSRQ